MQVDYVKLGKYYESSSGCNNIVAYISTCVNPTFYFFNLFLRRGGHCNHVVGLLFTLNHWFLLGLKEIAADKTFTSLPHSTRACYELLFCSAKH